MRALCAGAWPSVVVGLALSMLACGGAPVDQDLPPARTYQVRGVVRQIKQVNESKTQLSIHHEAIPEFVGFQSEVEGMRSMTMPFAVADSVSLGGIDPGSKVLFDLTIDWSSSDPGLITRLEPLPAETVLDFEAPQ